MRNPRRTGLMISTALMVLSGYFALFTVSDFGPLALIPPLFIFPLAPLGEYIDSRTPWYRRITGVISLLCLLMVPLWWIQFELLRAMVLLFVYIQAYEMLHSKTLRSYYHIYLMSFFLLVAACVESPDATIAVVMMMFLLSAVWAFFLLEIERAQTSGDGETATPDILELNERYATTPPPTPGRFNRGIAGTALFMSVVTLVMTIGLFLATPRMEAGLFGREQAPDMMVTGLSDSVNLTQGGSLLTDTTPVMHVIFPDEPEGLYGAEMYWRSHALNLYTGRSWDTSEHPAWWEGSGAPYFSSEGGGREREHLFRYPYRENGQLIRQQVYMDEVPTTLPVLDLAQRVDVKGAEIEWSRTRDGTVRVLRSSRDVIEFEAWSEVAQPDVDVLRNAPDTYRESMDEKLYEVYTAQDLLPPTLAIVRDVTSGADSVYDKAVALRNYLSSNEFLYTTEIPDLPQEHAIDQFIQIEKIGHCQLYASALALMLRSEGIPTRIVSGYRGGEYDSSDESYTIRADMAHVWVEVFFLGYGWVTFDPSPQSADSGSLLSVLSRQLSRNILRGKMLWYQNVVGFQSGFRLDQLNSLRANLFSNPFAAREGEGATNTAGAAGNNGRGGRLLWILAVVAVAGGVLIIRWMRSRKTAVHTATLNEEQRRAVRVYETLRQRLRRAGIDPRNVTPGELIAAVQEQGYSRMDAVSHIVDAYVLTRFGLRPMSKDRFAELAAEARQVPVSTTE